MWKRSLRCSISLGLLVAGVALAPAPLIGSPDETATAELAQNILSDAAYQTERPEGESEPTRVPVSLGAFATLLLYIAAAVAIILIAAWVVREFLKGATDSAVDSAGQTGFDADGGGGNLLTDPEHLAGQGRYEEAIHMLLLVAIRHLGGNLPVPPSPASTSRELLRALPMAAERREALGFLVRQVELSLFGGWRVGEDEYARCRKQFLILVPEGGR